MDRPFVIRFQRPELPPVRAIEAYYARADRDRWYSNGGWCHRTLVERLEGELGVHVVPVANCTLGLMLGLRALTHDRVGRQVVLPSYTFAATAAAVVWAGLEPVFADVDPDSWVLAPEALATALAERGDRVACVMPCATFGAVPPAATLDAWRDIARDAGVPSLVDSAAGFGAGGPPGHRTGALGDAEVFSLHATKPFAIGEGGLVCTSDAAVAEAVRRLANFGFDDGSIVVAGLNAKLAEWPAATALAVHDRYPDVLARRRASVGEMRRGLESAGLSFQVTGGEPTWQFVPVLAPSEQARESVLESTRRAAVEVKSYFRPALHQMPAFAACERAGPLVVTEDLARRSLSLPMSNDLGLEQQQRIVSSVQAGIA